MNELHIPRNICGKYRLDRIYFNLWNGGLLLGGLASDEKGGFTWGFE